MSEGRKTQIVLLDDRRLEILIQPRLYARELLDIVGSHFQLKEKDYFGLCFRDDTDHQHWLQLDRKVLEHDFPRSGSGGPLILYFAVRFFIESIAYLRDNATIELFYLQAKSSVYKGVIDCDPEQVFELAAHVVQATIGDYTDEAAAKKCLKKLLVLPTPTLQEHPNLGYCEEKVVEQYRKLAGQTRGAAIVNYMTIIESLPTYGIHYYEVKDKSGIPWWLGLSYKGISLYDYADQKTPRKVFAWKQLENLYFRDKKFSIEVHDPKRIVHTLSSFNLYEDAIQEPIDQFDELSDAISDPTTQVSVSRRTFGPGNVNVHAWFAASPQLTKCIWSMAVSQHQFYLDRKQSKSSLPAVRSMSEIAADLSHSTGSLHSSSANSDNANLSRTNSAHSLTLSTHNSKTELSLEEVEAGRAAQRDMLAALKTRRDMLEEALRMRTDELRALCIKEGELTGELPPETPQKAGESMPQIRRRMGTGFTLSPDVLNREKLSQEENALAQLELDYELQNKITEAALNLARDPSVAKSVRKKRKQSYTKASHKLKDLEKKLNDFRRHQGRVPVKQMQHYSSVEDLSEDSREFLDSESEVISSPVSSPALARHRPPATPQYQIRPHYPRPQHPGAVSSRAGGAGQVKVIASPKVEVVEMEQPASITLPSHTPQVGPPPVMAGVRSPAPQHRQPAPVQSRGSTPSPGPPPQQRHYSPVGNNHGGPGGYVPNAVYATQYRKQMYPSYKPSTAAAATTTHSSNSSQSEYDNMEGGGVATTTTIAAPTVHNLYNLNTHRTSRYDSCDELKSPASASSASEERSEYYDSFSEGRVPVPAPAHILQQQQGQGDATLGGELPELTPSRFGSKRESHSDYRDSPYQIVDMPPPPPHLQFNQDLPPPPREVYYDGGGVVGGGAGHQEYGIPSSSEPPHPHQQHPGSSIPYIDSSQTSLASSGSGSGPQQYQYRGGGGGYESDPAVSPAYPPGYISHDGTPPPPRETVSVTKYQNYVEVSKPFEMADAYKYSERRRKQQQHSASQSPQASPYLPRAHPSSSSRPASPYTDYPQQQQRQPQQGGGVVSQGQTGAHYGQAYSPQHPPSPRHVAYSTATTPDSAASTPHRSFNESVRAEMSFGEFDGGNLAGEFGEEMREWYKDINMDHHHNHQQQQHHLTPPNRIHRSVSHGNDPATPTSRRRRQNRGGGGGGGGGGMSGPPPSRTTSSASNPPAPPRQKSSTLV